MISKNLLASSSSLEGIQKLINKYFYSKNVEDIKIIDTYLGYYNIYQNGLILDKFKVIKKKNRYRFERMVSWLDLIIKWI